MYVKGIRYEEVAVDVSNQEVVEATLKLFDEVYKFPGEFIRGLLDGL